MFVIIFSICFIFAESVAAHPHAFIDMKSRVLVENNHLTGFSMQWLLDEPSSSQVLYDLMLASDEKAKQKLSDEIMQNIIAEHYFSYLFNRRGEKIKYSAKPLHYGMRAEGTQVLYYFDFMLSEPVALKSNSFILSTYDPTYYVAMLYDKGEKSADFSALPQNCRGELQQPIVSSELKAYALSLDKSQKDEDDTLGKQFAQQVVILCD
nr:zinc transporter binding subunit ZevA [Mesocricetibacter intestinalis]